MGEGGSCAGPLDVYLDKLGLLQDHDTEAKKSGRMLENVVAQHFIEATGIKIRRNGNRSLVHPYRPWMLATPDWITPEGEPVELKTARDARGWGAAWSEDVPDYYLLQLQWQMEVMGRPNGYFGFLAAVQDFRPYAFDRHQVLVGRAVEIAGDFWERVLARRPPEIDWTDPRTPGLVELLHRPVSVEACDLDGEAMAFADLYGTLGARIKELELGRARCRARVCERMGTAALGRLPDGREVRRKVIEIAERTQVVKAHERLDFRITKGRNHDEG